MVPDADIPMIISAAVTLCGKVGVLMMAISTFSIEEGQLVKGRSRPRAISRLLWPLRGSISRGN